MIEYRMHHLRRGLDGSQPDLDLFLAEMRRSGFEGTIEEVIEVVNRWGADSVLTSLTVGLLRRVEHAEEAARMLRGALEMIGVLEEEEP